MTRSWCSIRQIPPPAKSLCGCPAAGSNSARRRPRRLTGEFREELATGVANAVLVQVIENIYQYGGAPAHQILFLYTATLVDTSLYSRQDLRIMDTGHIVSWVSKQDIVSGKVNFYPKAAIPFL